MDTTIKITLDVMAFDYKPKAEDVTKIQTRLKNAESVKELTIEQLLIYIGKGHTIVPGVMIGGTKRENWIGQQLFEVDIDNTDETSIVGPEELISLLKKHNLCPFAYYFTFSNTVERPKFRLLFRTSEFIEDINKADFIIKTLVAFIPQADPACTNVSRLFYGTNNPEKNVVLLDKEATITLDDVVKIYKNPDNSLDKQYKNKDFWDTVKNYDWLDYIKKDNVVSGSETGNRVDFLICPICKHKRDFSYYKDSHTFCCYGAHGNVSGNFINYIMLTENKPLKEAIDKFKYDILGMPHDDVVVEETLKNSDLIVIQEQLEQNGVNFDFTGDVYWIDYVVKNGVVTKKVNCPLLAQFIRENLFYIFVRNDAKSGVLRYFYIDGYYKLVNDDEVKGLIKLCIPLKLQRVKDINEVLGLLYTDLRFVPVERINSDETIINFANGIFHVDTKELTPHSPKYLSTIRIPCNYIPNAKSPETHYFDNFIDTFTGGNKELKLLLLEVMGVVISNVCGYRMKKSLFMIGPGESGKSRLKVFLTELLGPENCSSIDLGRLEAQFGKTQLLNKRLVGANDMSYLNIPTLDTFKQATGGDIINGEYKHENLINFLFRGVLWFCGNRLPYFGGDKGDWTYNRIIVVKCDNVVPVEKRDIFLVEHLLEEKEYIVSICIDALLKVIENNYRYDIPEICMVANEKYKIDNDSFLTFYNECITERDPNMAVRDYCTIGKIFDVYKAYCNDNNRGYHNTKTEVKELLHKMGKDEWMYARGGNRYYKYLTLTFDANMEYKHICPLPDGIDTDTYTIQYDMSDYDF